MNNKRFTLWNRLTAAIVFVISAVTYLLTIEPTASFWDCGEFIASSYKRVFFIPLASAMLARTDVVSVVVNKITSLYLRCMYRTIIGG